MTSKKKEHRKLAAIMFTDMVGYSMLAQKNETLSLDLIDEHRRVLRPLFAKHQGHEIEAVGDAFFVEFTSALEAVRCAVEIQETLHKRNLSLPEQKGIRLRIGLHLGDVVYREKHVHGDGVNIAARIEPLAEAGGICVSEDVARQIQNKISLPIQKLGKGELKNIKVPVDIFRIVLPWEKAHHPLVERFHYMLRQRRTLKYGVLLFLFTLVIYGGAELYFSQFMQEPIKSIAVLPFRNSTEVPEYLADGLTQSLINGLSQLPYLRVISGNSCMSSKSNGQSWDFVKRRFA
jgi:class 3 adenylate cyclase